MISNRTRTLFGAAVAALIPLTLGVIEPHRADAQDLYVSNFVGTINKVAPDGTFSTIATLPAVPNSTGPLGMSFDSHKNLYVVDYQGGTVYKIAPSGAVSTFISGLDRPDAVAIDSHNNLYVVSEYAGTVVKITPDASVSLLTSGLNRPANITIDPNGNLYVIEGYNQITKITPTGIKSTYSSSGLSGAYGMVFDATGSLYVTDSTGSGASISKIAPGGGPATDFAHIVTGLTGLTIDGNGVLYASGYTLPDLYKINSDGTWSKWLDVTTSPSTLDGGEYLAFEPFSAPTATPEPGTMALLAGLAVTSAAYRLRPSRRGRSTDK